MHKFGFTLPKSVDEAYNIDAQNGNALWTIEIAKEMTDIRVAFKFLEDGEDVPIGYDYVRCHIIFHIKIEEFRRKSRLVAGGHMTKTPDTMTYYSVVSRETVFLDLVIATLNDLEVKCGDGINVYITESIQEEVLTTLRPEFVNDARNQELIVCALYGLKSAGAAFRAHLGRCMQGLEYEP